MSAAFLGSFLFRVVAVMPTRVELKKISIVGSTPSKFDDPIVLRVVLEVLEKAPAHPIDVKFTWAPIWDFPVDQELDELEVGPLTTLGRHEFVIESDAPDIGKIPDPTGPTALIISMSYKGKQFLHVGYNVVATCAGDLPEVFTSAEKLSRSLDRCFSRQSTIEWDEPLESQGKQVEESDDEAQPAKRTRGEEDAPPESAKVS